MAGSTTSTLDDLLPSIVQEAMFVASERSIMRGLVRNYSLAPGQGKTVTVPIYPQQTAAALTEGDEISNTEVATSKGEITISPKAIRTMVTDLSVVQSASNVVADLGRLFGEAVARKMDADLGALLAGFSTSVSFTNDYTTNIAAANIFEAVAKLRARGVSMDGISCVLHPEIAYTLKKVLTTGGTVAFTGGGGVSDVANEAMRMGYIGQLAGVPIYESANIAYVTNAGDFPGGVFHRDALGLALVGDISIETQRRASFLGTDVVASCHYGVAELYDNYGVSLKFDSELS
jgi:N4-gp56 family major capsid protein